MKNILFFTSLKANDPNLDAYKEWSLLSWQYYAKKYDLDVFILDQPLCDTEMMRPTWQRWYVYDLLEANGYDNIGQVALIDIDTMVRWDAPNIFEVAGDNYAGVIDDLSIEWIWNSIQGYKKFFPDVQLDWFNYINNGVLVLPKTGKEFCDKVKQFYDENQEELRNLQHHTLKKGTDQTPINYLARQHFKDIKILPKTFNMTHMYKTEAFIDWIFVKCSYIWHFNGIPREQRNNYMQSTWEQIKNNYI